MNKKSVNKKGFNNFNSLLEEIERMEKRNKLFKSVNKKDLDNFKRLFKKEVIERNKLTKRLYKKCLGYMIPENRINVIISFIPRGKPACPDYFYVNIIEKYFDDKRNDITITTKMKVDASREIWDNIVHYGSIFEYNIIDYKSMDITKEYIEFKIHQYGVELDNKEYTQLKYAANFYNAIEYE